MRSHPTRLGGSNRVLSRQPCRGRCRTSWLLQFRHHLPVISRQFESSTAGIFQHRSVTFVAFPKLRKKQRLPERCSSPSLQSNNTTTTLTSGDVRPHFLAINGDREFPRPNVCSSGVLVSEARGIMRPRDSYQLAPLIRC